MSDIRRKNREPLQHIPEEHRRRGRGAAVGAAAGAVLGSIVGGPVGAALGGAAGAAVGVFVSESSRGEDSDGE